MIGLALAMCVPVGGTAAYVHAASQPEESWTCTHQRDTIFMTGERITVRECTSWGFRMSHKIVRNDEARLFGTCQDRVLYYNEESDFPEGCDWIERTPTVFGRR